MSEVTQEMLEEAVQHGKLLRLTPGMDVKYIDDPLTKAAPDLLAVCKAYEQWEADLIMDDKAWSGRDQPMMSQESFDRLLEIQAMRNAAIKKAKGE